MERRRREGKRDREDRGSEIARQRGRGGAERRDARG